jgi:hypothetical protein
VTLIILPKKENMTLATLFNRSHDSFLVYLAIMLLFAVTTYAEDVVKAEKPKREGRPVFFIPGKVFMFPEGVEKPPEDYRGSIGTRPLALVTIDDKVVGEVYAAPLKATPVDEAKGMAASADREKGITLQERKTIKDNGQDVEVVTLKMDLKSNVGRPWILHSLYFPRGDASLTFKLVASQEQFKTVLPYFETMLSLGEVRTEEK